MAVRRLLALVALLAGLVLGGASAIGTVAASAHTSPTTVTEHVGTNDQRHAPSPAFPPAPGSAVLRAGHAGSSAHSLRDAALLPLAVLLTGAFAGYLVWQRRRTRPPGWHRSTLLARGPPLLLAR